MLLFQERREELHSGYVSGSIDFWTDSHRKEQYGAFVVNLVGNRYRMENGSELFMSRQTRDNLDRAIFVTGKPELAVLEFPLNFERFQKSKTIENVVEWMRESTAETKIRDSDFGFLSADGGSNAIGSIQEFEVVGRTEGRLNSMDFSVCASHQNERSGGYACGTIKFQENPNEDLGDILRKNHEIQVRLNRNPGRMEIYREVQNKKARSPALSPNPANVTRWQGMSCA